ncbi:hypothetical protein PG994_014548 [Apiospora phragmitis]|uniref:Uncharacterized protein n=1 Tax=Apiospora phragmitis TaxID=2905665 RepID=A0ABR1T685_9PEZI
MLHDGGVFEAIRARMSNVGLTGTQPESDLLSLPETIGSTPSGDPGLETYLEIQEFLGHGMR